MVAKAYGFGSEKEAALKHLEQPELAGRSRMSVLQIKREEDITKDHMLGPAATAFSLFKGFVGTGILYMPLNFI